MSKQSRNRSRQAVALRSPEDLLAAIPVTFGFNPSDSIVMMTTGRGPSFHARIDLPDTRRDWLEVKSSLLAPVLRHGVTEVVFIVYSSDVNGHRQFLAHLVRAFQADLVAVVDAIQATPTVWFRIHPSVGSESRMVPYDVSTHPMTLQAIVEGRGIVESREQLAASLCCRPDEASEVAELVGGGPALSARQIGQAGRWAARTISAAAQSRVRLESADVARFLVAIQATVARDEVWRSITRENAEQMVVCLSDVVARSPLELAAAPAALLAFAAWLSGNGALAWCAIERGQGANPGYPMLALIMRLLEDALPPTSWQ